MPKQRARKHRPDERDAPIRIELPVGAIHQPPDPAQVKEFLNGLIRANEETSNMLRDLIERKCHNERK